MTTLATPFRTILTGLQAVIGLVAAKRPPHTLLLTHIYFHLNRTIQRFEKLVTRWRDKTLPKPCKPRPGRPARTRATQRLPRGHAWLIRNVDHYNARGHASQLQHFLNAPECVAFLAEVPRAGRILRPLSRALGLQMPGEPPPPPIKPARPLKAPWRALPPPTVTASPAPLTFFPPDSLKIH